MGQIHELPRELVAKIAAGEVVTNPASVVKELIENSLDAKATQINVEIKEGGKGLILVSDNGKGMSPDDAILCVKRHATSKIMSEEDLLSVGTLGFRGEALFSMATVAPMKIITRHESSMEGTEISIENGKIISQKSIGSSVGTTVEVRNLFYETPARRKYLKADSTESSYVLDIILRYALQYYDVGFRFIHNDKLIFAAPRVKSLKEKIALVYGVDIAKALVAIDVSDSRFKVSGYVVKPSSSRSDRTQQTLFVNNRYVKSPVLSKAISEGYRSLLFTGKFPIFVLNIVIDPLLIDVNVHPAKTIVKIADESKLYQLLLRSVRDALSKSDLTLDVNSSHVSYVSSSQNKPIREAQKYSVSLSTQETLAPIGKDNISSFKKIKRDVSLKLGSEINYMNSEESVPFNIIGQYNKTYLLVETNDGLLFIDQHAAHERVLFEEFFNDYESSNIKVQNLLEPIVVDMNPSEYQNFITNHDMLNKLGFVIEEFGDNSVLIRSIPKLFGKFDITLFKEMMLSKNMEKEVLDKTQLMIATMACRAAIKAGDELNRLQVSKLLLQMKNPDFPYACPHGRPTVIRFTPADLEKLFKRKA